MKLSISFLLICGSLAAVSAVEPAPERAGKGVYRSEIVIRPDAVHNDYQLPLPHTYLGENAASLLPDDFTWGDVNGVSYLTHSLNQHLPQYCGSCWAHGALSAFADRIKIARLGMGDDINLSIQFILNCGRERAGSCMGGYHTSVYEFIKEVGFIPYDTCMPYIACSADTDEGFCGKVDTSCKIKQDPETDAFIIDSKSMKQVCRTCDTFAGMGGACTEIDIFPNATVAEYGLIPFNDNVVDRIMMEIYVRGPVAATINAEPIVTYQGGIFTDDSFEQSTNHIVAIVGWGTDPETGKKHWIIRNSWGQYWGEMGYMRLEAGKNLLGIEGEVAWVTPGSFTVHNFPCAEDGKNCVIHKDTVSTQFYKDPALDVAAVQQRLAAAATASTSTSTKRRYVRQ